MKCFAIFVIAISMSFSAFSKERAQSGTFKLLGEKSGSSFSSELLDLDHFTHVYERVNEFKDFRPCDGRGRFARVRNGKIEVCSTARKLGYKVVAESSIKVKALKRSGCPSSIQYELKMTSNSRPRFLSRQLEKVETTLCLKKDGETVSYTVDFFKGEDASILFYGAVKREITGFTPYLIKSVQETLK